MNKIKRITLYKIKPNVGFDVFLKGELNTYDHVQINQDSFEAYIKYVIAGGAEKTEDKVPWIQFLNSGFETKKYNFSARNRFPRAIMAMRINQERGDPLLYVATFGQHGDSFLEKNQIVYDFGIKVGMNICDIDRLRRLQTTVHESISKHTERQASVGANLSVFGINTEAEFLRTISGYVRPDFADVVESFKGRDSIAIKLPKDAALSWNDMVEICRRFDERYWSTDYRDTEFRTYDNLRHEGDPLVVEQLDELLCTKIAARDFSKLHLAPPEFVEMDDISYAYVPKSEDQTPPLYDDLRIGDIVSVPRRRLKGLTSKTLQGWCVYKYDYEQENTFPLWNAYQCLVAEIDLAGRTFVLANGQWREVSEELKEKVARYFANHDMMVAAPYLLQGVNIYDPDRNQNREDIYNATVAIGDASTFLFDKAKIDIAGKRLYEVCDLLHLGKQLVHVKKYSSGAASISHIFTQTKLYSHAFSTDEITRTSVLDWIDASDLEVNRDKDKAAFKGIIPVKTADIDEREYTVVFCILHKEDKFAISDLPFMSQYELMLSHRFLTEDRRFKVGVAFRRVIYGGAGA